MENCVFCKIVKGEISAEKVFEDDNFLAFLDITPINPGHILLIPKNHYLNIYEIPDELMREAGPIIKKLAVAVKDGVKSDGVNLGMNNGAAAGQLVMHAHFHIMPRFSNDGHTLWHGTQYSSSEEARETADKIRKAAP